MRIAFCGEYNSLNFGDGAIGLGLSSVVKNILPEAEVHFFDLSARPQGHGFLRNTGLIRQSSIKRWHRNLYAYSSVYAQVINLVYLDTDSLKKYYNDQISGMDLLVVGGGQLLMDNRLSFPLKLRALVECAEEKKVRVGFFSVGVGRKWSSLGARYLQKILTSDSVQWVSCRDHLSANRLRALIPQVSDKIHVTVDAAFGLTADEERRSAGFVGLGVISPLSVRANGISNRISSYRTADELWCGLHQRIASQGSRVILFCNGSQEDAAYLHKVKNKLNSIGSKDCVEVFVPNNEKDLIDFLGAADAIVAARMHANVIAFALGVPSVAIVWDDKVASFMHCVSREEFMLKGGDISVCRVLELMKHKRFYSGVQPRQYRDRVEKDFKELVLS